ncbi:MAG: DMT family transporter [Candidatus Micrarchaeota archaeon]
MNRHSAYFYLALTILSWSAIPATSKIALAELDNFQLLFYTGMVGVVSLLIANAYEGKFRLIKKYGKFDFLIMFLMGALGIFLYHVFLFYGYGNAPAGQANVFNYLWPVFIVLFSAPILKEKLSAASIIAISISFIGAMIAFTGGSGFAGEYAAAYASAGIAAVCYGLFSVLGKKLAYDKTSSMLVYYISSAILVIPATLMYSSIVIPKSINTIVSILFLGGIANSIAFIFWFKALEKGNTQKIANLAYAIPLLAMVWTYFLNSEMVSAYSIIGLLLILAGIALQTMRSRRLKIA